jgi:hypothetical protein
LEGTLIPIGERCMSSTDEGDGIMHGKGCLSASGLCNNMSIVAGRITPTPTLQYKAVNVIRSCRVPPPKLQRRVRPFRTIPAANGTVLVIISSMTIGPSITSPPQDITTTYAYRCRYSPPRTDTPTNRSTITLVSRNTTASETRRTCEL